MVVVDEDYSNNMHVDRVFLGGGRGGERNMCTTGVSCEADQTSGCQHSPVSLAELDESPICAGTWALGELAC